MNIKALEKLHKLKEKGVISDKEFRQQKHKILQGKNTVNNNYQPTSGCAIAVFALLIMLVVFSKYILILLFMMTN